LFANPPAASPNGFAASNARSAYGVTTGTASSYASFTCFATSTVCETPLATVSEAASTASKNPASFSVNSDALAGKGVAANNKEVEAIPKNCCCCCCCFCSFFFEEEEEEEEADAFVVLREMADDRTVVVVEDFFVKTEEVRENIALVVAEEEAIVVFTLT
jgi:hypothetical protein